MEVKINYSELTKNTDGLDEQRFFLKLRTIVDNYHVISTHAKHCVVDVRDILKPMEYKGIHFFVAENNKYAVAQNRGVWTLNIQ